MKARYEAGRGVRIGGKLYTVQIPGEPVGGEVDGGYELKTSLDSDGLIVVETELNNTEGDE
jgi:hypothetical protein